MRRQVNKGEEGKDQSGRGGVMAGVKAGAHHRE